MIYPRLVIAGTHSGVGKTTVTLALLAALKERGRRVQPFKVGPDFIDPGHHAAVTGRPSRNLDGWMLGPAVCQQVFLRAAADADVSIIEGVMGLFDGSSPVSETGSTAELAKLLQAPVLLVIDGSAMARSACIPPRAWSCWKGRGPRSFAFLLYTIKCSLTWSCSTWAGDTRSCMLRRWPAITGCGRRSANSPGGAARSMRSAAA